MYRAEQVDRRYNDWHYTLSRNCRYMDLDGIEFDQQSQPLALVETTQNPDKVTSVMVELARRCKIPAYLVILPPHPSPLTSETVVTIRRVYPTFTGKQMTLAEWGRMIERLHANGG